MRRFFLTAVALTAALVAVYLLYGSILRTLATPGTSPEPLSVSELAEKAYMTVAGLFSDSTDTE